MHLEVPQKELIVELVHLAADHLIRIIFLWAYTARGEDHMLTGDIRIEDPWKSRLRLGAVGNFFQTLMEGGSEHGACPVFGLLI